MTKYEELVSARDGRLVRQLRHNAGGDTAVPLGRTARCAATAPDRALGPATQVVTEVPRSAMGTRVGPQAVPGLGHGRLEVHQAA